MKLLMIFIIPVFAFLYLGFVPSPNQHQEVTSLVNVIQSDTTWVAPASADELVSSIEFDEESLLDGKMVYRKNCNSCHGRSGNGKGSGAADLDVQPSDFINPNFTKQSDGAIFWKTSEGRGEMKSYKSRLTEEEIWLVVNYIKTFSVEK